VPGETIAEIFSCSVSITTEFASTLARDVSGSRPTIFPEDIVYRNQSMNSCPFANNKREFIFPGTESLVKIPVSKETQCGGPALKTQKESV
jgi:hypothetical protein